MYGIILLTALFAGYAQMACGFGAGMILIMALKLYFTVTEAPAITQVICTVLSAVMLWPLRHRIRLKEMLVPMICYCGVSALAVLWIKSIDMHLLTVCFGAFLVLLSIYFLLFDKKVRIRKTPVSEVLCCGFSGLCSGLFGVGGPTLALYLVQVCDGKEAYLASLQLLFTVGNLISTVARIREGIYYSGLIPVTAVGCAGVLLGLWLGAGTGRKSGAEKLRTVVYVCVGISGLIVLLQNLR